MRVRYTLGEKEGNYIRLAVWDRENWRFGDSVPGDGERVVSDGDAVRNGAAFSKRSFFFFWAGGGGFSG